MIKLHIKFIYILVNIYMKFRRLGDVFLPAVQKQVPRAEAWLASGIFGSKLDRMGRVARTKKEARRNWMLRYSNVPGQSRAYFPEQSKYGRWLKQTSEDMKNSEFLYIGNIARPDLFAFFRQKVISKVPEAKVARLTSEQLDQCTWLLDRRNDATVDIFDYFGQNQNANVKKDTASTSSYVSIGLRDNKYLSNYMDEILSLDKDEVQVHTVAISPQLFGGQEGLVNAIQSIETPWKRMDKKYVKVAETLRKLASKDLTKAKVGLGNFLVLGRSE